MPDGQKVVQVPGLGNVAFPGNMDDASINLEISKALGNQKAATQPGAYQTKPGGPVLNATPAPAPQPDIARGVALGAAQGAGIPETQSPVMDLLKGLFQQGKDTLARLPGEAVPGGMAGIAGDEALRFAKGAGTSLYNTGGEVVSGVKAHDPEQYSHGLASGLMQLLMMKGLAKLPETTVNPTASMRNMGQEIMNEGPSKLRVLEDQHAHAIEVQKHVAGVAKSVHDDAQQAMASVAQQVDSAKPEGVFDKVDIGNKVKMAIGDTVSDNSQLPKSIRDLLPGDDLASKRSTGPTVGGRHFDLSNPTDFKAYQKLKDSGAFTLEEIGRMEGVSSGDMHSFSDLQQIRSNIGRQMQNLEGAPKAAANAVYAQLSSELREGARDVGAEPEWIDANARWKGYLDDFHRSPVKKTLFGDNASDIMSPLANDKTRVQVGQILGKYEPFGMDMGKVNQEVGRYNLSEKVDRLGQPSKRTAIMAAISPHMAAASIAVPRAMRNPSVIGAVMGKGFETAPELKPSQIFPTKEAAARALKGGKEPPPSGGVPSGNPPPFSPTSGGPKGGINAQGVESSMRPATPEQSIDTLSNQIDTMKDKLRNAGDAPSTEKKALAKQIEDYQEHLDDLRGSQQKPSALETKQTKPGSWTESPAVVKTIFDIENKLVDSGKINREDIPALRRKFTEGSDRYKAGQDYAQFLQRATSIDATPATSDIAKQAGLVDKGEAVKGSGVQQFEIPEQPGKTVALSAKKMKELGTPAAIRKYVSDEVAKKASAPTASELLNRMQQESP